MSIFNPHRHRAGSEHEHENPLLADVVEHNIAKLVELRRRQEARRGPQERLADALTAFSGTMGFAYVHAVWFIAWVAINLGWTRITPFDPFPFGLLTLIVSLEAIFLSTFVLISQNRAAIIADKRADLDLQVNLLAEHEITRILQLVDAIADHLQLPEGKNKELEELKKDVGAEEVMKEIEYKEKERKKG